MDSKDLKKFKKIDLINSGKKIELFLYLEDFFNKTLEDLNSFRKREDYQTLMQILKKRV